MPTSSPNARLFRVITVVSLFTPCLFTAGCGSGEGVASGTSATKESKAKGESKPRKSDDPKSENAISGTKSFDGIPWDVFFDKPLVVASNTATGAAAGGNTAVAANDASKGTTTTDAPSETKPATKESSGGGSAVSLKDLIDKDALTSEVKSVRNYLAGKATSVAAYNSSYLEIAPETATLAVLAVAVQNHPEDFSWKKNAKFVRQLASQITEMTTSEKAKNKNTYDAVNAAFEKIDEVLKGSTPAGLPEADDNKDYGDAAGGELRHVMKRLKKAEELLKNSVNNEAGLKKEAEKVAQEGAIIQFLGYAITSKGFGWGDDEGFAKQALPLREGGKQLIEAAKSGNYAMYDEAMSRIGKTCVQCHGEFKNN